MPSKSPYPHQLIPLSSSRSSAASPGPRRSPRRPLGPGQFLGIVRYGPVGSTGPNRSSPRRPLGPGQGPRDSPGPSRLSPRRPLGSGQYLTGGSPQHGTSRPITLTPVRAGQAIGVVFEPPG